MDRDYDFVLVWHGVHCHEVRQDGESADEVVSSWITINRVQAPTTSSTANTEVYEALRIGSMRVRKET